MSLPTNRSFSPLHWSFARLLLVAVAFHIVLILAISLVSICELIPRTFNRDGVGISFAIDSIGYHKEASEMAQLLQQGRLRDWIDYQSIFPTTLHIRLYSLGFATMGKLVGFRTLAAEPLNLTYYISILLLTYAIGRDVFGPKVGRLTALVVSVWPSFLLHTTQLLRDPLFISALLLLIWTTILCIRRDLSLLKAAGLAATAVFAIIVILLCRTEVKEILVVVLLSAATTCVAAQIREHRFHSLNILVIFVIVSFTVLIPRLLPARKHSDELIASPATQTGAIAARENTFPGSFAKHVGTLRHKFIVAYPWAGSNIDTEVELNSVSDLIRYLPRAVEVGLFAPFPRMWITPGVQVGITGRLVAGLEMCVMYLMFGFTAITLAQQRKRLIVWFLFMLTVAGCIALGYVVANISALYRMRYTFFIPVLILGVQGLITVRQALFSRYASTRLKPQ